jgi:hypothetical protein
MFYGQLDTSLSLRRRKFHSRWVGLNFWCRKKFFFLENLIFFNVHGSVHRASCIVNRESMSIIVQKDATICSLLYFCKLLYMFRVVTPPIVRSTYNCNYSIWHWSNFGQCSAWSQLRWEVWTLPSLLPSTIVRSIPLIFSWLHTLHCPKIDQCQIL